MENRHSISKHSVPQLVLQLWYDIVGITWHPGRHSMAYSRLVMAQQA